MASLNERPGASGAPLPPGSHRTAWVVFVVMAVVWGVQTRTGPSSWNESARLAAVESLVERGTHRIDDSPFAPQTKDKVFLGGHYYCDKPPLFQILAAVPYAALHHALGLGLEPGPCAAGAPCGYFWLTFLVVGLPSAATLALFFRAVGQQIGSARVALAVTALLALGTMLWPYSIVFNSHIAAGASLFGAFLAIRDESASPARRLLLAGLLAGLAASFDLLAVFPVAALAAVVTLRRRGLAVAFALGCSLPLLATAIADYEISGNPLPPYFSPEGYRYPGAPVPETVGGLRAPRSLAAYTLQGLVGNHGLLAASPVLLWPLVGLVKLARDRRHPRWLEAVAVGMGVGAFALYVFTRTDVHGGKAYGERYFLSLVPLVAYFAAFLPPPSVWRWTWLALAVAAPLSVVSAAQGARRTWSVTPPVVYLDLRPPWTSVGVCSSLAEAEHPCLRLGRRGR